MGITDQEKQLPSDKGDSQEKGTHNRKQSTHRVGVGTLDQGGGLGQSTRTAPTYALCLCLCFPSGS